MRIAYSQRQDFSHSSILEECDNGKKFSDAEASEAFKKRRRMKFSDIPKFTRVANYVIDCDIRKISSTIADFQMHGLQLNPDFQRGHVWTVAQQENFVEYILKGGHTDPIKLNQYKWQSGAGTGDFVCVDGLQRLTAVMKFEKDQIRAFGSLLSEFEDKLGMRYSIRISINDLATRAEVLQWYLELNNGGTVHTQAELDKVHALLQKERMPSRHATD